VSLPRRLPLPGLLPAGTRPLQSTPSIKAKDILEYETDGSGDRRPVSFSRRGQTSARASEDVPTPAPCLVFGGTCTLYGRTRVVGKGDALIRRRRHDLAAYRTRTGRADAWLICFPLQPLHVIPAWQAVLACPGLRAGELAITSSSAQLRSPQCNEALSVHGNRGQPFVIERRYARS